MKKLLIITLITAAVGVGSLHARLFDKAKEAAQNVKKKHDAFITSVAKQPAIQAAAQRAHAIGAGRGAAAQPAMGLMLPMAPPMSMTQLKRDIDRLQDTYNRLSRDFKRAHQKKNTQDIVRLKQLIGNNRAQFRILNAKWLRQPVTPVPVSSGKLKSQPTTTHGGPAKGRYSVRN